MPSTDKESEGVAPPKAPPAEDPYSGPGYPPGALPQSGYPKQGYPQQGYPQQGYPQQGYPQQGSPNGAYQPPPPQMAPGGSVYYTNPPPGAPPPYQNQQVQIMPAVATGLVPGTAPYRPAPTSHTVGVALSVATCFCCCPLISVFALGFSIMSLSSWTSNQEGAKKYHKYAMFINIASVVLGIIMIIVIIVLVMQSLAVATNILDKHMDTFNKHQKSIFSDHQKPAHSALNSLQTQAKKMLEEHGNFVDRHEKEFDKAVTSYREERKTRYDNWGKRKSRDWDIWHK